MASYDAPQFSEALRARQARRTLLPTDLGSADLRERISPELRERLTFSARVNNAALLEEIRTQVDAMVDGQQDRASARLALQQKLIEIGYKPLPGEEGTLKDLSSDRRLNLILDTNTKMAQGYAQWAQRQDPAILDQWPADEFKRVAPRDKPREDWPERFADAGGLVTEDGRMIALKNSPVWEKLSVFGLPYPPFDFGSGMGVIDVTQDEAMQLGLIDRDTPIEPQSRDFERDVSMKFEGGPLLDTLLESLGGGYEFRNGVLRPAARTAMISPHGMQTGTLPHGGRDEGDTPEATASDISSIVAANAAREGVGFGAEQKAVEQWARDSGRLFAWEDATAGASEGGVEHLVAVADGLVQKITKPPVFGLTPTLGADGRPALRDASPLEYLARWALHNEEFGDAVRIFGGTAHAPGWPSFLITQRFIAGRPPTEPELIGYMLAAGFRRVPGEWVFYHPANRLAIFDARPANFVWVGRAAVSFDEIPIRAGDAMHAALMQAIKE